MLRCSQPSDQASDFRVVLGEHNRRAEEGTEKIIDVVEIIVHERYNRSVTDNDMALFRLAEDVAYTRSIKPICLPRDDVTDNMMCITAGWGHTLGECIAPRLHLVQPLGLRLSAVVVVVVVVMAAEADKKS